MGAPFGGHSRTSSVKPNQTNKVWSRHISVLKSRDISLLFLTPSLLFLASPLKYNFQTQKVKMNTRTSSSENSSEKLKKPTKLSIKRTKKSVKSRKDTNIFLVGQPSSGLPPTQLPVVSDVLKYLHYRREMPEMRGKTLSQVVCCPLMTGEHMAKCYNEGGCSSLDTGTDLKPGTTVPVTTKIPCVVACVQQLWQQAGIKTFKDESIR